MTDTAGPFDGAPWAEAQWARHAATWAPSGVYGPPAASTTTGDLPLSVSALTVGLGAGRAWVRGFGFERTGAAVMQTVTANTHGSFSRRDRIVLRRNLATHTITQVVIQGTPAPSPAPPALTQSDSGSWDIPCFSFLVPPNSGTSITGAVDERVWVDPGGNGPALRGVELFATTAGLVVPPNTASPTAFASGDVVGQDRDGYLQAGSGSQVKIPPDLGGVYTISWGGAISGSPTGRHFWDLIVSGSRTAARRANGYGEDTVAGFTELRLAAGDTVKFNIYVAGSGPSSGNWPVLSRYLSCYLKGA